jgi:hypothetical protein
MVNVLLKAVLVATCEYRVRVRKQKLPDRGRVNSVAVA